MQPEQLVILPIDQIGNGDGYGYGDGDGYGDGYGFGDGYGDSYKEK